MLHLYAAGASVKNSHDLASLPVHMKVEVKVEKVPEDVTTDATESSLQTAGKIHQSLVAVLP